MLYYIILVKLIKLKLWSLNDCRGLCKVLCRESNISGYTTRGGCHTNKLINKNNSGESLNEYI